MENLKNLTDLEIGSDNQLSYMPIGIGKLTCLQTLTRFIVGKEKGAKIGELQNLNLRGKLNITDLQNVRNKADASEASLDTKQYLRYLLFSWSDQIAGVQEQEQKQQEQEHEDMEGVLEGLQPHTNLERLWIKGYGGSMFPAWMSDKSFTNLVRVDLSNCKNCERLPRFGALEFLKHLIISMLDKVTFLSDDGTTTPRFPKLEFLELDHMLSLEELFTDREGEMPSLKTLRIESCPKLRSLPQLPLLELLELKKLDGLKEWSRIGETMPMQNLNRLKINGCPKLIKTFPFLPRLEILELKGIPDLEMLSERGVEMMPRLLRLKIEDCPKLRSLPLLPSLQHLHILSQCTLISSEPRGLQGFKALKTLELSNCDSIAVTLEHHESLESLLISDCPDLPSLPPGLLLDLTALQSLEIRRCRNLGSLPERLENFISLRSLSVTGCKELVSLPQLMQHLSTIQGLRMEGSTDLPCKSSSSKEALDRLKQLKALVITYRNGSLQYLYPYSATLASLHIHDCPKLESLPEGLEYLTTIRTLDVAGCALLEKRYGEGGVDSDKIKDIPYAHIDRTPTDT